jgi:hypothetical protein
VEVHLVFLLSNYSTLSYIYLTASLFFISSSIALVLSAKNHRWLFYIAFSSMTAYSLVSFTDTGNGVASQYLGGIIGIVGELLVLRSAFQREFNKQYNLPMPLDLLDKFPMAGTAVLAGTSTIFILIGSIINQNIVLILLTSIWLPGYICLFLSDEYLRKRLNF